MARRGKTGMFRSFDFGYCYSSPPFFLRFTEVYEDESSELKDIATHLVPASISSILSSDLNVRVWPER